MKEFDLRLGLSYTPLEMIKLGIFEGLYVSAIPNLPSEYYRQPTVLSRGSEPDITLNKFKVKSRMSLKDWEKNGWVTDDNPLGWFQWYCNYFNGKRFAEDDHQIKRARSYIRRHMGTLNHLGNVTDESLYPRLRQGLLQWGWDSTTLPTEEQFEINAKRLSRLAKQ